MDQQRETTAAEQLAEIRRQRRELAHSQVTEAARELAATGTISGDGADLLNRNLVSLEMTEAEFSRMVDVLRSVPSLERRVGAVDRERLYLRIQTDQAALYQLAAKHKAAEQAAAEKLAKLRQEYLSVDTAALQLAAIQERYGVSVGLPNVRL